MLRGAEESAPSFFFGFKFLDAESYVQPRLGDFRNASNTRDGFTFPRYNSIKLAMELCKGDGAPYLGCYQLDRGRKDCGQWRAVDALRIVTVPGCRIYGAWRITSNCKRK